MMNINNGALEFFLSIPDDMLVQIAEHDWESLENICVALTLDIQMLKESTRNYSYEDNSNWGNLC